MRPMRLRCLPAALALLAACVHRPPPPLHTARLEVEKRGHSFRPFVRATVAGQPLRLLVDTGAYRSMLPARFARANKLPTRSAASDLPMVDANGNVAIMRWLPDVPVRFEGEAGAGTMDFLMNGSEGWDEAVLVPQELVRSGWAVVIDLDREELSYEPEAEALKRLVDGAPLREVDYDGCRNESLFGGVHRLVSTTINGVPARMLVDTGAETTALARNNPALPSMGSAKGIRGKALGLTSSGQSLILEGVPVEFAGTTFTLPTAVLPASAMCGGGMLGADVLRHCTLVWGSSSLWAACRAPPAGGEPPGAQGQ